MNGRNILILGILLGAVMPTLGFFSPGSALALLLLFFVILLIVFKGITIPLRRESIPPAALLVLAYAAYYYGGFYQPPFLKAMGQLIFFAMIAILLWRTYIRKQASGPWFFVLFYLILAGWTLITSPHPHVDTVVVFKEAPLKLLQGINPYNAIFSPVYPHIVSDYYNHLPVTFLLYLPFAVLPIDERIALVAMTVSLFLLLYRRLPKKARTDALLPLSLVLFMPGSFYMLEHMYSETMIFFFFSLFIFFSAVSEKWQHLFLAFFFTVKQNILLTLPYFISRKIFRRNNWLFFLVPFLIVLVFFIWNPPAFLDDTLFDLAPGKTASPVAIALTFPNLLRYFLPDSIPVSIFRTAGYVIFAFFYLFITLKPSGLSATFRAAAVLLASYFFSHYAYFNSYYLILLLFLLDFIIESYVQADALQLPKKPLQ